MIRSHRGDAVRVVAGHEPGDAATPVVADEVDPFVTRGADEGDDVADEVLEPVGGRAGRPGTGAVASLVRGVGPHPRRVQSLADAVPARAVLREAVQQHDRRAIVRPGVRHVEDEALVVQDRQSVGGHVP